MTSDDLVKRLRDHEVSRHHGGCQDSYGCLMDDAADEIERLRNQLAALPDDKRASEDGWRPIETAPRDGTRVLIADEGVWMAVARFWPCNMHWTEDEVSGMKLNDPTHWRPLPAPPTPSREPRPAGDAPASSEEE